MNIKELMNGLKSLDYEERIASAIQLTKVLSETVPDKSDEYCVSIAKFIKTIKKDLLSYNAPNKKALKNHCLSVILSIFVLIKSKRIHDVSTEDANFKAILSFLESTILKQSVFIPLVCYLLGQLTTNVSKHVFKSCILQVIQKVQKKIDDHTNPDLILLLSIVKSHRKKSSQILNIPDYFNEANLDNILISLCSSDEPTIGYFVNFLSTDKNLDNFNALWMKLHDSLSNDSCPIKIRVLILSFVFHIAENASGFASVSVNILSQPISDIIFKILCSRSISAYNNCTCIMSRLIKNNHTSDECNCADTCVECNDDEEEDNDDDEDSSKKVNGNDEEMMEVDAAEEEEEEEDSSDDEEIDESDSELTGTQNDDDLQLLKSRVKSALGTAALNDEDEDDDDDICFDDDTMFQLDASLAAIFSSRRPDKGKEKTDRLMFDAIQKRCMDNLENLLKLSNNFDLLFACLLLLLRVAGASLVKEQIQRRAATIIANHFSKKSRAAVVTVIIKSSELELTEKLPNFLESIFQILKQSGNSQILLECIAVILKLFGGQPNSKLCVISVVKKHFFSFLHDRSSHLTATVFIPIFKNSPELLWQCREFILSILNKPDARTFSRLQALRFVVLLDDNKSKLENVGADDFNTFSSSIINHCLVLLKSITQQIDNEDQNRSPQTGLIEAASKALTSSLKLAPSNVKMLPPSIIDDLSKLIATIPSKQSRRNPNHCKQIIQNFLRRQQNSDSTKTSNKRKKMKQNKTDHSVKTKKQKT